MLSIRKGAKKRCCYGVCRSDTRSKSFQENLYYFISFPKPCFEYRRKLIKISKRKHLKICPKCAKCDLWVKRCGRGDGRFQGIDNVNKDTYICSLHFEGESGPTTEYPDPISCVKEKTSDKVKVTRTSLAEKYKESKDLNTKLKADPLGIMEANNEPTIKHSEVYQSLLEEHELSEDSNNILSVSEDQDPLALDNFKDIQENEAGSYTSKTKNSNKETYMQSQTITKYVEVKNELYDSLSGTRFLYEEMEDVPELIKIEIIKDEYDSKEIFISTVSTIN